MVSRDRWAYDHPPSCTCVDCQRRAARRQHALAILGWTSTAMLDLYTAWMQQEGSEALDAFRKLEPFP